MDINETSLLEIWEVFCDFIPPAKRNDVAVKFLNIFLDQDVELGDLEEIRGEDEHIDNALDELSNESILDDEEEYDE